jgi:ATP-dependent phosphofructokinase / diphosphate-dependent phosphofructokinase
VRTLVVPASIASTTAWSAGGFREDAWAHVNGRLPTVATGSIVRKDGDMRIGMLTGGGDCPGLNAVIRAVVRKAEGFYGHEVVGFRHGWRGVMDGETMPLTIASTRGLIHRGGTILGTSRTNPYQSNDGPTRVHETLARERIDAVVAIGGEDTLGVAAKLAGDGMRVVGVPKTIDNDLSATDFTFGFHTAVQIATDAIDRLHTTAESHDRVMIVEVMGRHAGWIAVYSGIAGGADLVLVPEVPFDISEVCARLEHRHRQGANFSIVVVAEGAVPTEGTLAVQSGQEDEFGHVRLGGISSAIQDEIHQRTGFETRVTVLGHVLRGGTPTAYDRVLATRFGIAAIDAVHAGHFGTMTALRGDDVVWVPIEEGVRELKTVDAALLEVASVFFA